MTSLGLAFAAAAGMASQGAPLSIQFAKSTMGQTVTVCLDGVKVKKTFAGRLAMRDARRGWSSFCADVRVPVAPGQIFRVNAYTASLVGGNVEKAGNIVGNNFYLARNANQCAALQLAVWEAIEDGGAQADFESGRFMAQAHPQVLAMAQQAYEDQSKAAPAVYLRVQNGGQSQLGIH